MQRPNPPPSPLHEPARDAAAIAAALGPDRRRLVACLCAGWCSACAAWHGVFEELAHAFPDDCFVWIDIEDHSELVAEVEVETLPVLLIESVRGVSFVGPVEPRAASVRSLLAQRADADRALPQSGIRAALLQLD